MLLKIKNLTKKYKQGDGTFLSVLDNLNFTLNDKNVAIMGESGSGKTTLLNCISGLDTFESGSVLIDSFNIKNSSEKEKAKVRSKIISFVFQFHYLIQDFTVLENVSLPLMISGIKKNKAEEKAYDILKELKIYDKSKSFPSYLSGGEKQRVAIARALITKPKLLLMDEPTGNLDEELSINIVKNILNTSNHLNTKILLVTHDKNIAMMMDKIYIMNNKRLEEIK